MTPRPAVALTASACLSVLAVSAAAPAAAAPSGPKPVEVQLLAFNDFHGALEPPTGSGARVPLNGGTVDAGGAAYFATHRS